MTEQSFPPLSQEIPANGDMDGGGGNRTRETFPPLSRRAYRQNRLIDVAWAAGLFEGEGTIGHQVSNGRIRLRFALGTTDPDVLVRFHAVVGCGQELA